MKTVILAVLNHEYRFGTFEVGLIEMTGELKCWSVKYRVHVWYRSGCKWTDQTTEYRLEYKAADRNTMFGKIVQED